MRRIVAVSVTALVMAAVATISLASSAGATATVPRHPLRFNDDARTVTFRVPEQPNGQKWQFVVLDDFSFRDPNPLRPAPAEIGYVLGEAGQVLTVDYPSGCGERLEVAVAPSGQHLLQVSHMHIVFCRGVG